MATRVRQQEAPSTKSTRGNRSPEQEKKTKKQICIALLKRSKGASLAELEKATGWQPHTVRGFLSGTVKKIAEITLSTETVEGGARRYRVIEQQEGA